jgi:hypothetical protein
MSRIFVRNGNTEAAQAGAAILEVGSNLHTAEVTFRRQFGSITSLERDLLTLAASIFATDRGVQRGEREDFARSLDLSVPVVNAAQLQPLIPLVIRSYLINTFKSFRACELCKPV